ncbi:MAG TPA: thiamine-phosphate kinase [Candidatus Angelobacter sp.]|nr:thiamine-phosphate kinase [Candidatus Angelobacter sp.]
MSQAHLSEDSLLGRFRRFAKALPPAQAASRQLLVGIGDDAALFRPKPGCETILTCDWFLEGTHFLRNKHPADSVGWKCLARAVSDVAAMGGVPRCFLLSLAIPSSLTGPWLGEFLRGLRRASRRFRCALAGGDTTRRAEILINVTIVGEIRNSGALLRSGARPGDLLFVSGRLGEAERGLQLLRRSKKSVNLRSPLLRKHLYPEPRLALGRWLAAHRVASAMMDLSDGLSSDLRRLGAASGVGVRIEAAKIPTVQISARHRKSALQIDPLQLALHGGDDYELLFTVPTHRAKLLPASFRGIPLTIIGIVTSEKRIVLADEKGREHPLVPGGWDPFRSRG